MGETWVGSSALRLRCFPLLTKKNYSLTLNCLLADSYYRVTNQTLEFTNHTWVVYTYIYTSIFLCHYTHTFELRYAFCMCVYKIFTMSLNVSTIPLLAFRAKVRCFPSLGLLCANCATLCFTYHTCYFACFFAFWLSCFHFWLVLTSLYG